MENNKRIYKRYVTKEKLSNVSERNKSHIQKYFSHKNMSLADSTKKSYENDFNQFLVFTKEKFDNGSIYTEDILQLLKDEDGVEEMVDLLEDYMAFCSSYLGNNERRIQRRMSSISSFFLYLVKKRRIKTNPMDYMERPSLRAGEKPQVIQTFLSESQIDMIRKHFKKNKNIQLELYFEFSLSTMARVNAVNNVLVDNIDIETRRVERVMEKEGKEVTLFFSKRAKELISEWLKFRKKNDIVSPHLFLAKQKNGEYSKVSKNTIQTLWVKKIGNIINVNDFHAHDLRHSGSNILYQKGMKLEEVSELLNHSGTDVTQKHYIKKNLEKLQLKKDQYEF